jgi:hypothetical protein
MKEGLKRLQFRNNWEQFTFSMFEGHDVNCGPSKNDLTDIRKVYVENTTGDLIPYDCHSLMRQRSYSDHGHVNFVRTKDYTIAADVLGGAYTVGVALSELLVKVAVYVQDEDVTVVNPSHVS